MYYDDPRLGQPGEGKAIYLYAHARTGMFLPLLTSSKVSNGNKMKGMIVEVWTNDDQRFLYVITQVLRHVPYDEPFIKPFAAKGEQLWLQTSEGVGHAAQAPGRCRAAVAGGRSPQGGEPRAASGELRLIGPRASCPPRPGTLRDRRAPRCRPPGSAPSGRGPAGS